jgi:hypothetical protein
MTEGNTQAKPGTTVTINVGKFKAPPTETQATETTPTDTAPTDTTATTSPTP